MIPLTRRYLLTGGLGLLGAGALAACTPQTQPATAPSDAASSAGTAITHVHAITRDPATGVVLLATHEGLFRLENKELTRVGPVVDLMGFTVTPEGRYLASGHPSPGTELPEPLGLAESTDGGQSWSVLSRGGESDFHTLAAGPAGVIAFDGQLRTSTDGRTWAHRAIPSPPAALTVAQGSGTVLATTEDGVLRSTDHGATWTPVDTPQLMSLIAWADDTTIVGAGIDGRLLTSTDAGTSWTTSEKPLGEITALGAARTQDGDVETLLVVDRTVVRSLDGGDTTDRLL
ncbi:F510_1955 family glycosylhydrolase [Kocuria sp. ICS0012]|uniref:F510_1955 family glycosylhydrolase n=1 Tax=Kocuria sp. ICS0012 TaxID=1834155 RepID=UPI0007E9E130|nr:hypothetical protein [Kocuria sp. ICS0012]OBA45762.1 hypothetical protein A5728_11110 [Kocuria sp. ICS0012]